MTKVVSDALKLLSWELNAAKITVTKDLDPSVYVMADSTRLAQVMINVIRNAIEAAGLLKG